MSEGKPNLGWIARNWWRDLQPDPKREGAQRGNPATLAKLRRVSHWAEAAAIPETLVLFRRLGKTDPRDLERVAVLAAVLAHVREETDVSIAGSIGKPVNDDDAAAVLSELRLLRLLRTSGSDDILIAFRRLVALMGRKAKVADLAEHILFWDDGEWGDRRRVNFAFNYWKAGDAAKPADQPTAE